MVSQKLAACNRNGTIYDGSCLSGSVAHATPDRRLRRANKSCGFLLPDRRFPFIRIGGFAASEYPLDSLKFAFCRLFWYN